MTDLEQLKKALNMANAGQSMQQPLVDQVLQELIEVNNPLRQNLPRKPGSGSDWILVPPRCLSSAAGWGAC